jgi:putative two-component system response regulator
MTTEELKLMPGARVLVAEGDEPSARQVRDYLESAGHTVLLATDGEEALRRIRRDDPDIAIVDVCIKRINAYQLCERVKTHPTTRSIPVIMLVSPEEQEAQIRSLEVGAEDFLNRPVNQIELLARVRSLVRAKRLTDQAETAEHVIFGLAEMLESKLNEAGSGAQRLADYACLLGSALGLGFDELDTLRKGAALHDIGKIGVREQVLTKNGRLTDDEYQEMKLHPEVGERLCASLADADNVLPIIRYYRERWDGKGYPDGLRGEQIPLLARVMSIADSYDAMLSARPYRPALAPEAARESLRGGAGTQWDPHLIEVFLGALRQREQAAA